MEKMPECIKRTIIYESDYVSLYTDKVRFQSGAMLEKYHQIHYPKEAVAVVVFNEKNDILFIHNRRYTVGHLEWEIPAGKIETEEEKEVSYAKDENESMNNSEYASEAQAFNTLANNVFPYEGIRKSGNNKSPWF